MGDLCDAEKKKEISTFAAMSSTDLQAKITEAEAAMKMAEEEFEAEVKKLQEKYEQLESSKSEKVSAIKKGGLSLMKAVAASKGKEELWFHHFGESQLHR